MSTGNYIIEAERSAGTQYEKILRPYLEKYIKDYDITIMDFACGEGRIVNQIRDKYKNIVCCDLPKGPLEVCRDRFKGLSNILYVPSTEKGIELGRINAMPCTHGMPWCILIIIC